MQKAGSPVSHSRGESKSVHVIHQSMSHHSKPVSDRKITGQIVSIPPSMLIALAMTCPRR